MSSTDRERLVMLDARTLEEIELVDDPEREAALQQMIQDHGELLQSLYTDHGSWEIVGQLLGYIVEKTKGHT